MSSEVAISVRNVSKVYHIFERPQDPLLYQMYSTLGTISGIPLPFKKHWQKLADQRGREFHALRDISFEAMKGESIGIIGRNGSGKSTLLQIIAGTLEPTEGDADVRGRVAALLELGSGFNPEFTGRENVYLNGAILGLSRREMDDRIVEIADFADIGEFFDQPVKFYSSGMFVRLAFAVQAFIDPDILIVDEALSVGDVFFQQKCHARIEELLNRQTTILIVSHDMRAIEKYSNRVMLLERGECVYFGSPSEAVLRYYRIQYSQNDSSVSSSLNLVSSQPENMPVVASLPISHWPAEDAFVGFSQVSMSKHEVARCTAIGVCDREGLPCTCFEIGAEARFYYEFELLEDIQVPIGGIVISNVLNVPIHGKTSLQHLMKAPPHVARGARLRFRQTIHLDIAHGEYTFAAGLATIDPECYGRATEMVFDQLCPLVQALVWANSQTPITVIERTKGLSFPFHGYADLRGECELCVLEQ